MSYQITRRIEWDSGHRVPLHGSKCKHVHGHRYAAEITCSATALTKEGFVIDFGVVKHVIGEWIDAHWDHNTLYQRGDTLMEEMAAINDACTGLRSWFALDYPPTAEHLSQHLFTVASTLLTGKGLSVDRVRLYETPNCWADYPRTS